MHFINFYWVIFYKLLGKGDILEILKEKTNISKKDIETVLDALAITINSEVLQGGHEIRLKDIGTFKQKKNAARTGRNPRTGEPLAIPASTTVSLTISSALKVKETKP